MKPKSKKTTMQDGGEKKMKIAVIYIGVRKEDEYSTIMRRMIHCLHYMTGTIRGAGEQQERNDAKTMREDRLRREKSTGKGRRVNAIIWRNKREHQFQPTKYKTKGGDKTY